MEKVAILVLGDIDRSPRMLNHAEQFSKEQEVYFFGYYEGKPRREIMEN